MVLTGSVVVGLYLGSGHSHKLVLYGCEVKATSTIAARRALVVGIMLFMVLLLVAIILGSAAIHLTGNFRTRDRIFHAMHKTVYAHAGQTYNQYVG